MIPVLDNLFEKEGLTYFKTTDHVVGLGFELTACDLETEDGSNYNHKLLSLIRSLPANALGRIKLSLTDSKDDGLQFPRFQAVNEIGFKTKKCLFFIEIGSGLFNGLSSLKNIFTQGSDLEKSIKALKEIKSIIDQSGLVTNNLNENILRQYFMDSKSDWVKTENAVFDGKSYTGIIRLIKPKTDPVSIDSLARILSQIDKPVNIDLSFRKIDSGKTKIDFEKRLKQTQNNQNDPTLESLQKSTVELIQESLQSGAQILDYEFIVSVVRSSRQELNNDLKYFEIAFNQFAEFKIETFGASPSWCATLIGNNQHVSLKELDRVFTSIMPIWHYGEVSVLDNNKRALTLHRNDQSLYNFDLFDPNFSVYNALIIGTSGKGKSVLTGMLSQALLNDQSVSLIKLDVGGSHSKECELFGGFEFKFQLDKPSGINPFEIVSDLSISDADKIGILSRFLTILIQEQNEFFISKSLRSQIEESISIYLNSFQKPSLLEFYNQALDFPRRNLLKRWVKGGVFENAFSTETHNENTILSNRLRYYNFSQIFQASDPEFAQAGIAAVLVQFNYESLKTTTKRIVLVCDETPFFIKSCFDFFKFTTANVRKYGHSVILITQLSTDLIVNDDTGIIENSPQRFLFSVDGDIQSFQKRFQLSAKNIESIKSLRSVPKIHSEVLLQTPEYVKNLKIKITRKEYWNLTSNKQDKEKLEALLNHIPHLKLNEAIQCLSIA